ncbi:MAG: MBL fold metallo-hydrolase [Burkholderiaceae bacterium]
MSTWTVGDIRVTRIEESVAPSGWTPEQFLKQFDLAVFRSYLPEMPGQYSEALHRLISSIHSWVIRIGDRVILVDACCGNQKPRPWMARFDRLDTPYLERLRAAGIEPEDVDTVLCTHLHADHVGWNTRLQNGRWVPTFPNARYLFSDLDDARFNPERNERIEASRAIIYNDSVLPIVRAGQACLVHGSCSLGRGMLIEPAPGHTPGHVSLKIENGGQTGVFCGDVLHHVIQVFLPDWSSSFCEDPAAAVRSRRRLLDYCADTRGLLFPTHFAAPYAVRVDRRGTDFRARFEAAAY